jgi:hypothetical protein
VGFVADLGGEFSTLVASKLRMPTDRNELIAALYEEGVPGAEIAEGAGVCVKTVRNVARRVGLAPRNPAHPERDAVIVRSYRAGEPVDRIASQHGVSRSRVRAIAARAGVPARHGVVPQKTTSMRLSDEASRRAAVWLGVLDGDGSVGIYKGGRAPKLSFAGTEALMEQCERFWWTELGIEDARPAARPHAKGIWTFSLWCAKAEAAARVLIGASPISMRRKRGLLAQIAGRTA